MKKRIAPFVVGVVVVFVAGVLVQLSSPVPNESRGSAVARWTSEMYGELRGSSMEMLSAVSRYRIVSAYGKLPLSFEANRGQTDSQVKFVSRSQGYSLFLTGKETVLALSRDSQGAWRPDSASRSRVAEIEEKPTAAPSVLRMKLAGANPAAEVEGIGELPGKSNYFIGNDPKKWRTNVPHYAKVRYRNVYPGVDLVYYGNQQRIEHDFIVAPGADPKQIRFAVNGADKMELSATGDLVLHTTDGDVLLRKPTIYQRDGTVRTEVAGGYTVAADNHVAFALAAYDVTKPLVIDPVLEYATYVGGSHFDTALGIAVDAAGSAYITGWTGSLDFPTQDPLQPEKAGPPPPSPAEPSRSPWDDIYVTKLTPDGSALVYSTYLGGSEQDRGYGIAVDRSGNAYVVGRTWSTDFPVQNALQPTKAGLFSNAVVVKLNAQSNALIYSTYLGGSGANWAYSIATDAHGNAYVAGVTNSPDFPQNGLQQFLGGMCDLPPEMIAGPRGRCVDVFVAKLPPDGSQLVYSARLGGNKNELFPNIAVDGAGNAYVAGQTQSEDFPTTDRAFQFRYGGGLWDVFVSKLDARGNALVFSTYLGGPGDDFAFGIALTPGCASSRRTPCYVYVTGQTNSTDFPVTPGALQTGLAGKYNAFVAKLNPDGSGLVYSTYLGGTGLDAGDGIGVDAAGNAYVAGETTSTDFPTTNDALQRNLTGLRNVTVSILTADGRTLVYSTYFGGNDFDASRAMALHPAGCRRAHDEPGAVGDLRAHGQRAHLCNIYVAGATRSQNFPTTENAFQRTYGGGTRDAFVVKFAPEAKKKKK